MFRRRSTAKDSDQFAGADDTKWCVPEFLLHDKRGQQQALGRTAKKILTQLLWINTPRSGSDQHPHFHLPTRERFVDALTCVCHARDHPLSCLRYPKKLKVNSQRPSLWSKVFLYWCQGHVSPESREKLAKSDATEGVQAARQPFLPWAGNQKTHQVKDSWSHKTLPSLPRGLFFVLYVLQLLSFGHTPVNDLILAFFFAASCQLPQLWFVLLSRIHPTGDPDFLKITQDRKLYINFTGHKE